MYIFYLLFCFAFFLLTIILLSGLIDSIKPSRIVYQLSHLLCGNLSTQSPINTLGFLIQSIQSIFAENESIQRFRLSRICWYTSLHTASEADSYRATSLPAVKCPRNKPISPAYWPVLLKAGGSIPINERIADRCFNVVESSGHIDR